MKTCYNCRQQIPQLSERCGYCTTRVDYYRFEQIREQVNTTAMKNSAQSLGGGGGATAVLILALVLAYWWESAVPLIVYILGLLVAALRLLVGSK